MSLERIVERSFYISEIITDIKPDSSWGANEIKTLSLVLHNLKKNIVYFKKNTDFNDIDLSEIEKDFCFSSKEFEFLLGKKTDHISRELKKLANNLMKKIITTDHPLNPGCSKSFQKYVLFPKSSYNTKNQIFTITIADEGIKRLLVFIKYGESSLELISKLNSKYSIYVYMFIKLLYGSTKGRKKSIKLSIPDFKEKIGLAKKYKDINLFRQYVLDVIKKEINGLDDITINYELHKTGKRYSHITFDFSDPLGRYKETAYIEKSSFVDESKIDNQLSTDINEIEAPVDTEKNTGRVLLQLRSYGIKEKEARDLVTQYGENACSQGIQSLLSEIEKGKFIKNTGGYLVKCIKNNEQTINSDEISMAVSAEKDLKIKAEKRKAERFKEFDRYIERNEKKVLLLIEKYKTKNSLCDDDEISMFNSLTDLVNEYKDIVKNKTPLTTTYNVDGKQVLMTCSFIADIVNEIKIASNSERVGYLKKQLAEKQKALEESSEPLKESIHQEILKISVKIANLV